MFLFHAVILLSVITAVDALLVTTELSNSRREVTPTSVNQSTKAGLAWPNGDFVNHEPYLSTGKVSWYYTWSPHAIDANDMEFVPMLWGQHQVDDFTSSINKTLDRNRVSAILGMNEPQQTGQSNLTPAQGADMWKTYLEPLKAQHPGLRLGTPAPSSAPSGKTWLQDWLVACAGGCSPDFVALHWYDVNATQFQLYLEDFHNTFQLPIWVTEWACQNFNNGPQCSQQEVVDFLNQTQSFMDKTPWIERYSWFGVMENLQGVNTANAMMDPEGHITALGVQYIGGNISSLPSLVGSSSRLSSRSKDHLQMMLGLALALNYALLRA